MLKNFQFILILLLVVVSCKNNDKDIFKTQPDQVVNTKSTSPEIEVIENKSSITKSYINDSLVQNWLKQLKLSGKNQELILSKNKHDSTKVDTIVNIITEKNKIELYVSENRKIVKSATLRNPGSGFQRIKIGMDSKDFEKIIEQDISSSTIITLSNLEQTNQFEFIFQHEKLTEINYEGYLE